MEDSNFSTDFWKNLKSFDDNIQETVIPPIPEEKWINHFSSLHSENSLNKFQKNITEKLQDLENSRFLNNSLDFPINETELKSTTRKVKCKKSPGNDKIQTEMIKQSLQVPFMLDVLLKLFNLILNSGTFPTNWCDGLITPIFKSGKKDDPGNYRGICVSSNLSKVFCMIINDRITKHFSVNKSIDNCQIVNILQWLLLTTVKYTYNCLQCYINTINSIIFFFVLLFKLGWLF